ncbi:MAG: metallophosphoesterase [Thermoplasmata archaeon]
MRIGAVGDIHGEAFKEPFLESLEKTRDIDLFLIAGDVTDGSDIHIFRSILSLIEENIKCPIVCTFGNEEYEQDRPSMREASETIFLDDESITLEIDGTDVKVVGSTGCLDRPTWWQRTNIAGIFEKYNRRIFMIGEMLTGDAFTILLTHYPPTYETLGGEKERYWPEMGCRKLERVVLERRPNMVFHGHAHRGIPFAELRMKQLTLFDFEAEEATVPVYNVAFPLVQKISVIMCQERFK